MLKAIFLIFESFALAQAMFIKHYDKYAPLQAVTRQALVASSGPGKMKNTMDVINMHLNEHKPVLVD
jgi:hypothetical protein